MRESGGRSDGKLHHRTRRIKMTKTVFACWLPCAGSGRRKWGFCVVCQFDRGWESKRAWGFRLAQAER